MTKCRKSAVGRATPGSGKEQGSAGGLEDQDTVRLGATGSDHPITADESQGTSLPIGSGNVADTGA